MKQLTKTSRLAALFVGIFIAANCHAQSFLTNGLVAYYPFNGNANDESGNGNNGEVHDATLASDRFGKPNSCYAFNGVNSYISFGSVPLNQIDNWTITAWIKPASLNQNSSAVTASAVTVGYDAGDSPTANGFAFDIAGSELTGIFGGLDIIDSGYSFASSSQWYQVVMLRNSGVTEFFVNGLQTTHTETRVAPRTPTSFTIGSANSTRFYSGSISDVHIYNRPLSPTEVAQLYNVELNSNNPTPLAKNPDTLQLPAIAEIAIPPTILSAASELSPATNEVIQLSSAAGELRTIDAKSLLIETTNIDLITIPLANLQDSDLIALLDNKLAYSTLTSLDYSSKTADETQWLDHSQNIAAQKESFEVQMRQIWLRGKSLQDKIETRLIILAAMRGYNKSITIYFATYSRSAKSVAVEDPDIETKIENKRAELAEVTAEADEETQASVNNRPSSRTYIHELNAEKELKVLQSQDDSYTESMVASANVVKAQCANAGLYSAFLAKYGIIVPSSPQPTGFYPIPTLSMRLEVDAERAAILMNQ